MFYRTAITWDHILSRFWCKKISSVLVLLTNRITAVCSDGASYFFDIFLHVDNNVKFFRQFFYNFLIILLSHPAWRPVFLEHVK